MQQEFTKVFLKFLWTFWTIPLWLWRIIWECFQQFLWNLLRNCISSVISLNIFSEMTSVNSSVKSFSNASANLTGNDFGIMFPNCFRFPLEISLKNSSKNLPVYPFVSVIHLETVLEVDLAIILSFYSKIFGSC